MKKLLFLLSAVFVVFALSLCVSAAEMEYRDGAVNISGLNGNARLIKASYDEGGMLRAVNLYDAVNGANNIDAKKR